MTIGIYKIENTRNGKIYVGQSKNVERRFREHKRGLNRGDYYNTHLQNSWNDYGEQAFSFEIVEECEIDELDELEIAYIMKYNTMDQDFGYNLESGGNTNKTDSPETRAKKSKNHAKYWLGKPRSEETKNKISETNKGWKHSEEEKLELSRRSNSTGFYRVHKQNNKNCKQGFIWKYSYYENKKRKSIYDTKFSKLMLKVTLKDLPWKIVDIDKAMNTINEINKQKEMI